MQQTEKKILMPTKGVANLSPDPVCSDEELMDCEGLTFEGDALRVVQDVKKKFDGNDCKLCKVHHMDETTNYLFIGKSLIAPPTAESGDMEEDVEKENVDVYIIFNLDDTANIHTTKPMDGKLQINIPVSRGSVLNPEIRNVIATIKRNQSESVCDTDAWKDGLNRAISSGGTPTVYEYEGNKYTFTFFVNEDLPNDENIDTGGKELFNIYAWCYAPKKAILMSENLADEDISLRVDVRDGRGFREFNVIMSKGSNVAHISWDSNFSGGMELYSVNDAKVTTYTGKYYINIIKNESCPGANLAPSANQGNPALFFYYDNEPIHACSFHSEILGVETVGNTVIVSTATGLEYLLWKPDINEYHYLGDHIPIPKVEFKLFNRTSKSASSALGFDLEEKTDHGSEEIHYETENVGEFRNLHEAVFNMCRAQVAQAKAFAFPFFVSYAVRLSGNTYIHVANPILMLPTVLGNEGLAKIGPNRDGLYELEMSMSCARLCYKVVDGIDSEWSDIVKGIDIFVTRQALPYENVADRIETGIALRKHNLRDDGIYAEQLSYSANYHEKKYDGFRYNVTKNESEYIKELVEDSIFFKLFELGTKRTAWRDASVLIKTEDLKNLETCTSLTSVDYYSHCNIRAKQISIYNGRLNAIGCERGFWRGFSHFTAYDGNSDEKNYVIEVTIKTPTGNRKVIQDVTTMELYHANMWFYYPDPRATHVRIFKVDGDNLFLIIDEKLTEHPRLNGAYYIGSLPYGTELSENHPNAGIKRNELTENVTPEKLSNYLLQSETYNPFVFNASGYVRVGQGIIIGMAALTTALSQDMYKIATTIVFTTQGIWALQINGQGQYVNVTPPFSREVCSNPDSITMVDNAVFFVSKKGLMLINDDGIRCVSEQLRGKNNVNEDSFIDFLQGCRMAYDYRDSQLWIINNTRNEEGERLYGYHWIYNMKTGTFSRKEDGREYISIVGDYPDTLLQDSECNVYSMIEEPGINDDPNYYNAMFTTRPMKFGSSLTMKTLREMIHICDFNRYAEITVKMEASNDCKNWVVLSSLNGRGWKYFRFRYSFKNLQAYDAFCGSVITYDHSETNRIR